MQESYKNEDIYLKEMLIFLHIKKYFNSGIKTLKNPDFRVSIHLCCCGWCLSFWFKVDTSCQQTDDLHHRNAFPWLFGVQCSGGYYK